MRSNTTLRTAFRMGLVIAAAAGTSFAATSARADVADADANGSTGTAALKYDYTKGLDTTIDTGARGFSAASVTVKVGAKVQINPVTGSPLYSIDMPKGAVVKASWSGDKKIVLKTANGSQTDGSIAVRHTLTPDLYLQLGAFGINATINYDADKLVNMIPGSSFNYDSQAKQEFAPWGFTAAAAKLNAPDLDDAELFSLGIDQFPELISENFDGTVGVRATTKPTFSYKTTTVQMSGSPDKISAEGGQVVIDAPDADYLESMAAVGGTMDISGSMDIQPFVHLTSIPVLGSIDLDIPITVYSEAYTVPTQKVQFQSVMVHIPLPNVHVPTDGVDLGSVKSGATATKIVTIENSGEKAAVVTFKSSDAQFSVPSGSTTIAPKSKFDMKIEYAPSGAGASSADITVLSNDADSPSQGFKVGANGADVGSGDSSDKKTNEGTSDSPAVPSADSGCGCKAAGTTSSSLPSWAGFGLLGLVASVFARRRQNKA